MNARTRALVRSGGSNCGTCPHSGQSSCSASGSARRTWRAKPRGTRRSSSPKTKSAGRVRPGSCVHRGQGHALWPREHRADHADDETTQDATRRESEAQRASRSTRAGAVSPTSSAILPPIELPTRCARSSPSASSQATKVECRRRIARHDGTHVCAASSLEAGAAVLDVDGPHAPAPRIEDDGRVASRCGRKGGRCASAMHPRARARWDATSSSGRGDAKASYVPSTSS